MSERGCRPIVPLETREEARRLYCDEGLSGPQVAVRLKLQLATIETWRKRYHWKRGAPCAQPTMRAGYTPETRERVRALYVEQRKTREEISRELNMPLNTVKKWITQNGWTQARNASAASDPRVGNGYLTAKQKENISAQKEAMFSYMRRRLPPPTQDEADRAVAEWLARGNKPKVCEMGFGVLPDRTVQPMYRMRARGASAP